MKNILKKLYYFAKPQQWSKEHEFKFIFVFHTEKIHDAKIYKRFIEFCTAYKDLTGKKVLATLMSPVNSRHKKELKGYNKTVEEYANIAKDLSNYADLGYHGHFWRDDIPIDDLKGIKSENYNSSNDKLLVNSQIDRDINWFLDYEVNNNDAYTAGWWYNSKDLYQKLIQKEIIYDFSHTHMNWVNNAYSKSFLKNKKINYGEIFNLHDVVADKSINCIQTIAGCHSTRFVEDFIRHLNKNLSIKQRHIIGALATHDYNLIQHYDNALNVIKYLVKQPNVQFLEVSDLKNLSFNKRVSIN